MRYNEHDARQRMRKEQLEEVRLGEENGVDIKQLLRPELSAEELLKLRTELETAFYKKEEPAVMYEATDYGPEELTPGFRSESNFFKYPDRVCYVPENWDFEYDGRGYTANDIIQLCNGDKRLAQKVFHLCDWQHPSTVLDELQREEEAELDTGIHAPERHAGSNQPTNQDVHVTKEASGHSVHPESMVVNLAHLAGSLEAEGKINAPDFDLLTEEIHTMIDAYMKDPSESKNPFCLEDATERYFLGQYGRNNVTSIVVQEGWARMTPSELIAQAKAGTTGKQKDADNSKDKPASQSLSPLDSRIAAAKAISEQSGQGKQPHNPEKLR